MSNYFEILCGVAAILLAVYYYATSTFEFWKNRGVVGPRPLPFLGNIKELLFARKSIADYVKGIYDAYKNVSMVGLYSRRSPFLVLHEPELIKDVLIRDFSNFTDRQLRVHEKTEPLSPHLINLESKRWRPLRNKLSPAFTSGKLREMFYIIVECSHHFEKYLDKEVGRGEVIECRELTAKFTTDVIGSCAFGIEMRAMEDEDSEFRKMGREVFAVNLQSIVRLKIRQFMPMLYDLLGYVLPHQKFTSFFTRVVSEMMKYRRENNIVRPDFINILMEFQKHPDKLQNIELTDTLLTAQVFVFFIAGFETSSTTMSNALYELALNQEIQDKLREEIEEHCAKNGELKYDDIKRMKYLDKVFKETLRMYPPAVILKRYANSNYTFNGTNVSIPKRMQIWIPVYGIHRHPDIYPNPEKFDPERFNEDAVAARHPMHYLPFGGGPRNCIGARFAIYQTKVGLITILRNYKVDVCDKTMIPYEIDPGALLLAPKGGIYLKMTKIPRECKIIS